MPSLQEQLTEARQHVEVARQRVVSQTALIESLKSDGHNAEAAERLLGVFLGVLDTFTHHCDELERKVVAREPVSH